MPTHHKALTLLVQENGGETGIRTQETLASLTVFKTAAFNHSATSPRLLAKSPA